jgi:adenylylsulfate kinase
MSVVWLNGPVGAGKTTLAYAVRALVHPVSAVALLDEDAVRQAILDATPDASMNATPDASSAPEYLCGVARLLAQQGFVVVVAASDTMPQVSLWNRANLPGYREVYLRASPETIKHRNRRRRPNDGAAQPIASLPQPAALRTSSTPPPDADLTVDMDNPEPPELLAFRVAVLIPEYVLAAAGAAGFDTHRLRRGA